MRAKMPKCHSLAIQSCSGDIVDPQLISWHQLPLPFSAEWGLAQFVPPFLTLPSLQAWKQFQLLTSSDSTDCWTSMTADLSEGYTFPTHITATDLIHAWGPTLCDIIAKMVTQGLVFQEQLHLKCTYFFIACVSCFVFLGVTYLLLLTSN